MPTDLAILQARLQNDMRVSERDNQSYDTGVHRLPSELLSHIFLLGEQIDRATRPRELWYLAVQDIATQVCRHWRNVAINNPILWTHIHITRSGSHSLALLYLARAGDSALLDVTIELRPRYCDPLGIEYGEWEVQCELALELCQFLASHNAPVSRWKSLSVCAIVPDVPLRFIEIICAHSAPNLRFLSCRWPWEYYDDLDEERILEQVQYFGPSHHLSPLVVPSLRCVEFDRMPWSYIFNRPSSAFSGLKELRLTSTTTLCSPHQLQILLSSNPQLETLILTTERASLRIADDLELITQRVRMERLHILSVNTVMNLSWTLCVLQMIEAPELKKLSLSSFVPTKSENVRITELCGHHSTDLENNALTASRYPCLNELDIHNFLLYRQQVMDMFTCWPSITRLCANRGQVEVLKEDPSLLPRLSYLKIDFEPHPQLGVILSSREAAGFPIKVVDLPKNRWKDEIEDELPKNITIVEHDAVDFEIDNDDSLTELESWVTDDSHSDWFNSDSDDSAEPDEPEGGEWVWSVNL